MLSTLFRVHLRRSCLPAIALLDGPVLLLLLGARLDPGALLQGTRFGDLSPVEVLLLLVVFVLSAILGARALEPATRHLAFLHALPVRRWQAGLMLLLAALLAFLLALGGVVLLHPEPLFAQALVYALPGLLLVFLASCAASFLPLPSLLPALLGLAASGLGWLNLINATWMIQSRDGNTNPLLQGLGGGQPATVFQMLEMGLKAQGRNSFWHFWRGEEFFWQHLAYGLTLAGFWILCLRLYALAEPGTLRGRLRALRLYLLAGLALMALPWGLRLVDGALLEREPWSLESGGAFLLQWDGRHAAFFESKTAPGQKSLQRFNRLLFLDTETGKLSAQHRLDNIVSLAHATPSGIVVALIQEVLPWSWLSYSLVRYSPEGAELGRTPLPLDSVDSPNTIAALAGDRLLLAGKSGNEALLLSLDAATGRLERVASVPGADSWQTFSSDNWTSSQVLIALDEGNHVRAAWRVDGSIHPLRLSDKACVLDWSSSLSSALYNRFLILEDRFLCKPDSPKTRQLLASWYGPLPTRGGPDLFPIDSEGWDIVGRDGTLFSLASNPKTGRSSLYARSIQGAWRAVLLDEPIVGGGYVAYSSQAGVIAFFLEEHGRWRPYLYDAALDRLEPLDADFAPPDPKAGLYFTLSALHFKPGGAAEARLGIADCGLIFHPGQPGDWTLGDAPSRTRFQFGQRNERGLRLWPRRRPDAPRLGQLILEEPGEQRVIWPPNGEDGGGR